MKEGYQKSSIGSIPKSWKLLKLGDICDVRDGTHDSPKYHDEGIPFITSKNLTETELCFQDIKYISKEDHISFSKRSHVENGDILFGMIGTVGKPVIVNEEFEFSIKNVALLKFSIATDLNNVFALNILKSSIVDNQFKKMSNGGVLKFVALGNIRNLLFPIPDYSEQQRIAEILSTVDAKIEIIDQQISETQELKKGLMQQLLTKGIGHTEFKDSVLGKIPKSWEVLKVGDTCSLKGGFAFKSSDSCEHGIRWVKIANVGVNKIKWNDESFLPHGFEIQHRDFVLNEGDIILAMTRPILNGKLKIARISKFDSGSLLNQRVGRILENNNLNKDFAYQVFNSFLFISAMEKELVGTDPPNISSSMFEELNIALPPLKEQVEIAEILTSYDQKLEVLSEKKTTYQELKQGLMQQLLTGKMRV
jgi:type I restriction enzyme S subunit